MKVRSNSSLIPVLAGAGALFVLAGLLHAGTASAAPVTWENYNRETIRHDILPAYQRLADEAQTLADAADALCQSPDAPALARTRQAFNDTLAAWQGISAVQFGPIQFLMRNYAIQYWPDRKSIGRRQLQAVLDMPADTRFDDRFFHHASVSIKGLPALEQLLYRDDALTRLQGPGLDCRLTRAIAGNVAGMTRGVYTDWQQGYEQMLSATPDDDDEMSAVPELSVDLMKSLVEPIELIRDTKLLAVMGRGPDATYPHRAESWMSERSLSNIRINIEAAQRLYHGETAGLDRLLRQAGEDELAARISAQFERIEQQLAPLGDSLLRALEQDYDALGAVATELKTLNSLLNEAMLALNVQLGFNSRDGD
jgi:predicted lipoprotein